LALFVKQLEKLPAVPFLHNIFSTMPMVQELHVFVIYDYVTIMKNLKTVKHVIIHY